MIFYNFFARLLSRDLSTLLEYIYSLSIENINTRSTSVILMHADIIYRAVKLEQFVENKLEFRSFFFISTKN